MGPVEYSAMPERPALRLPDGARVAIWVVPNIEHYEYVPEVENPWRKAWTRSEPPDVVGYGARDFGNRVGVWRLFEAMDRHEVRCTVSLNTAVLDLYPEVIEAADQRRWDYLGHGIYNTRYHWGLSRDEEAAEVGAAVARFREHTGRTLAGWLSPALSVTAHTPEVVAEHGIKYYCDWQIDDQPWPVSAGGKRLISMPYTTDLNDAVAYRRGLEADAFAAMVRDAFDVLYEEGSRSARVLCLAVHPYLMGQPHRIDALDRLLAHLTSRREVWVATGEEIADWYSRAAWPQAAGAGAAGERDRAGGRD